MSARLLVAVQKSGLPRTERAILAALCEHVADFGLAFRWSVASIAEAVGCSGRTVQRGLPKLVSKGYLTRREQYQHASAFTVTDPAAWPARSPVAQARGDKTSDGDRLPGGRATACRTIPCINKSPGISDEIPSPLPGLVMAEVETKISGQALTLTHLVALYHRHCPTLPRVREPTDRRRAAVAARCRENQARRDPKWWGVYFRAVAANDLLNGEIGRRETLAGRRARAWIADFDWLLNRQNMAKVREGRYDDSQHDFQRDPDAADEPTPARTLAPNLRRTVATLGARHALH